MQPTSKSGVDIVWSCGSVEWRCMRSVLCYRLLIRWKFYLGPQRYCIRSSLKFLYSEVYNSCVVC